jgi:hypothetical protein
VVERIRDQRLSSEETGNLVKALKKRPDRAQEILESPADHLLRFFADTDPIGDFREPAVREDVPIRMSPYAQHILDFLPSLSGIDLSKTSLPEVRQIEDALTSLQMAVSGLLHGCRERLGE